MRTSWRPQCKRDLHTWVDFICREPLQGPHNEEPRKSLSWLRHRDGKSSVYKICSETSPQQRATLGATRCLSCTSVRGRDFLPFIRPGFPESFHRGHQSTGLGETAQQHCGQGPGEGTRETVSSYSPTEPSVEGMPSGTSTLKN